MLWDSGRLGKGSGEGALPLPQRADGDVEGVVVGNGRPTALKPPCYRDKGPCGAMLPPRFSPQGFVCVAHGFSLAAGDRQ